MFIRQLLKNQCYLLLTMVLLLCSSILYGAKEGTVIGVVSDAATNKPLPAANVIINTPNPTGAATDLRGNFTIIGIPGGDYELTVNYIGYQKEIVNISVQPGEVTIVDVELKHQTLKGKEVVVTAQAWGQASAINQQIQSNSVVNIVSAQRIQEIPEASAAEAVGRLPGVSLKGSKLVIRGLSPHYNKIQIDGIDMASTDFYDRSSSLGMISQYMLEGIEMTKTAMPDHDADVIGARVNLKIKEAPEKPTFNLLFQNGYNTLSKSYGNQRIVGGGSKRFLDNRLGVFGQMSFERSDGASNRMSAAYEKATRGVSIRNMSLSDVDSKMKGRLGATVVLDYKTPLTKLKMSNFFSRSDNESIERSSLLNIYGSNYHNLNLNKSKLTVITNSLSFSRFFSGFELDGGVNYSFSRNEIPEEIGASARVQSSGLDLTSVDLQGPPIDIPKHADFNLEDAKVDNFTYSTRESESQKFSVDLNMKTRFSLTDWLGMKLKIGGKFRHQKKNHDLEESRADFSAVYMEPAVDALAQDMPWLPDEEEEYLGPTGDLAFKYFVDNYQNNDFLLGGYKLGQMASEERVREVHEWMLGSSATTYYKRWEESFKHDYHGYENYAAAYIKPEIIIGRSFTFIPGVRYEKNKTSYNGYRLPFVPGDEALRNPVDMYNRFVVLDTTKTRDNEFILPMIHAIYRPLEWFVARASYTHTLSRPSFGDIIPSWDIGDMVIDSWNNPYLKPEISRNRDLSLSFNGSKIGLFTLGGFHKSIENMIFMHGVTSITKEDLENRKFDGLCDGKDVTGYTINYKMNNTRTAHVYGYEVEWQSNFWYLPGLLKGLVLNVNYTRFYSDAKYPKTDRSKGYFDFETMTFKYTYTDTFYVNRLIDQANHIFNIMLGFDYKGFSIRGAMKYTDNLFAANHEDPVLRVYTDKRIDYDVSITQKLPVRGLTAYCNIQNIGRSKHVNLNAGSGYPTLESYGGAGCSLGLRYGF